MFRSWARPRQARSLRGCRARWSACGWRWVADAAPRLTASRRNRFQSSACRSRRSAFHIELKLHDARGVVWIVGFYCDRLRVRAGRLAGLDFNLDRAGLTRPEDFGEVHGCASSAWSDRFNFEIFPSRIPDGDRANERLVLRLLAEIQFLFRRNEFRCARVGVRCVWVSLCGGLLERLRGIVSS